MRGGGGFSARTPSTRPRFAKGVSARRGRVAAPIALRPLPRVGAAAEREQVGAGPPRLRPSGAGSRAGAESSFSTSRFLGKSPDIRGERGRENRLDPRGARPGSSSLSSPVVPARSRAFPPVFAPRAAHLLLPQGARVGGPKVPGVLLHSSRWLGRCLGRKRVRARRRALRGPRQVGSS